MLTLNTYPYNESFETGQGNWVSGGTGNDWAWGTPSKPTINSAGSGTKCWIVGGLTTSFYNNGERSWVKSPCFDFSGLAHPYITFKIFWETEHQYDGATFQYSLDGGITWSNVGSNTDPVNCFNANWFNFSSITNLATLSNAHQGWTGTTQPTSGSCQGGSGSGGWVLSKHCMPYLAGEQSVMFRFAFGAGTTCNDFDGFAFDDVTIKEAPVTTPDFSFSCQSSNTVSFTDLSGTCPNGWSWNFDDPGSGSNNLSAAHNPSHTFSGSGTYNVTLTTSNTCSAVSSVMHTVNIVRANAVAANVSCFGGNNGSAVINVTGGSGSFTYLWNTTPVQTTATASGLSQGTYTYIVTGTNSCPDTNRITINQPAQINHNIAVVDAHCGFANGAASEAVNGGTPPYVYNWSSGGGNVTSVSGLAFGNYSVTVTDSQGCGITDNFIIHQQPLLSVTLNTTDAACGQTNGSVLALTTGGTAPYSYSWSPNVSTTNSANNLGGGNYMVTTTDASGCVEQDTATILQQPGLSIAVTSIPDTCTRHIGSAAVNVFNGTAPYTYLWDPGNFNSQVVTNIGSGGYSITVTDSNGCFKNQTIQVGDFGSFSFSLGDDATICTGNEMLLSAGNYLSYQWQDSSQLATLTINNPGTYSVTVTNSLGCSASDTILVKEECLDDVIAPNAFSPNGDGKNDFFFASGLNVTSFNLQIFNRWGERIFESNNIGLPWDGVYHGRKQEGDVYVWVMDFSINNKDSQRKVGSVLLIR